MSPIDFIYSNIEKKLLEEGFSQSVASRSAQGGVDEYKRRSCATQKGKIFDDCLYHARQLAKLYKKATNSN